MYREKHVHIAPGIGFLRTGENRNTKRKTTRSNGETRKHTFDLLNFSTVGKNVLLRTIIVLSVMPHLNVLYLFFSSVFSGNRAENSLQASETRVKRQQLKLDPRLLKTCAEKEINVRGCRGFTYTNYRGLKPCRYISHTGMCRTKGL